HVSTPTARVHRNLLEHDNRDPPACSLRVSVVAGIQIRERAPQLLAFLPLRVARAYLPSLATDRHLRERIRTQVEVPERVPRGAPLRGDHCVAIAGVRVRERLS